MYICTCIISLYLLNKKYTISEYLADDYYEHCELTQKQSVIFFVLAYLHTRSHYCQYNEGNRYPPSYEVMCSSCWRSFTKVFSNVVHLNEFDLVARQHF